MNLKKGLKRGIVRPLCWLLSAADDNEIGGLKVVKGTSVLWSALYKPHRKLPKNVIYRSRCKAEYSFSLTVYYYHPPCVF